MPPEVFIVQDCFGYTGFFVFPYEVEVLSRSLKNFAVILIDIALNPFYFLKVFFLTSHEKGWCVYDC